MAYADTIPQLTQLLVEGTDTYINRTDTDSVIVLWTRLLEETAKILILPAPDQ